MGRIRTPANQSWCEKQPKKKTGYPGHVRFHPKRRNLIQPGKGMGMPSGRGWASGLPFGLLFSGFSFFSGAVAMQ
jgi:hypothetical protein